MKLLSINKMYPPEIGGVEVVTEKIAKFGKILFNDSVVLTFNSKKIISDELIDGVKIVRLPSNFRLDPVRWSFEYPHYFKMLSKDASIILFHFPAFQPEIDFIINNRSKYVRNTTKICFFHAEVSDRGMIGEFYNRILTSAFLNRMDKIIVTSPNVVENSKVLQKYSSKINIIPLFVDAKHFYYREDNKRTEILNSIKIKVDNPKIVLYVGRLGKYKGLKYLIESMLQLPPNYLLVIVGEGQKKSELTKLVKDLELENRVLFFSRVPYEELPYFYSAADVFVLPSTNRGEAFGIVVLEAMACGVPVITTKLGTGTTFHNIDQVTGLHVEPRDSKRLALAIKKIIEEDWKKIHQNVIISRAQEFDKEIFEERIKKVLTQ